MGLTAEYRIVSFADMYAGHWLAIRVPQMRLVKSSPSVTEVLRWVATLGQEPTHSQRGSQLSPRAIARIV